MDGLFNTLFYVVEAGSKKPPVKVYSKSANHYEAYRKIMFDYDGKKDLIVIDNLTGIAKRFAVVEFDGNGFPEKIICLSDDYKGYLYEIFG